MVSFAIRSQSPDDTRKIGECVGRFISAKTVIVLNGDLGCGKTVFVAGLAKGLDVPGTYYITSPTYAIINEYPGRLPLFHIDLYRIADADELDDIGFEEIQGRIGVMAIEWAERISSDELRPDLSVQLTMDGENSRRLHFFFYGRRYANLVDQLKINFEAA